MPIFQAAHCSRMRISPGLPIIAACLGISMYAGMDTLMKGLGLAIGAYSALFWRMMAGAFITSSLYLPRRTAWPTRPVLMLHAARSMVVAVMGVAFFWGITQLPLAEAVALSFVAPLIALGLAAIFLKERIGLRAVAGSVLGLGGVAVILAGQLRAGAHKQAWWGAAAILGSAVLYAINLVMARHQAQLAKPLEIAAFQNAFVLAFLSLGAPFFVEVPGGFGQYSAIVAAAGFAVVSLLLTSWAYARAEAQVLLPVEYTIFIWAAIAGWLFFDETLTAATLLGTVLIVSGCVLAAWRGAASLSESEWRLDQSQISVAHRQCGVLERKRMLSQTNL